MAAAGDALAEAVDEVESALADSPDREIPTHLVGEILLKRLRLMDKIAYVRFASVYKDFQNVETFLAELKHNGHQRDALPKMLTRAELYGLLGYTGYEERDRAYFGDK